MITIFIILLLTSSTWCESCKCGIEQQNRIINGKEADKGRYPWMVSLLTRVGDGKYASCGGSLINDRYVLTAAHCLAQANSSDDVLVTLFAHTTEDRFKLPKVGVESLIKNPVWGSEGYGNHHDLSLIKLREPQVFSASFTPICLPTKNTSWSFLNQKQKGKGKNSKNKIQGIMKNVTTAESFKTKELAGNQTTLHLPVRSIWDSAFVTGWGHQETLFGFKVKAKVLYEAETEILHSEYCQQAWKEQYDEEYEICAGTAACQGDSGGPLALRVNGSVTQIGVVSYGPKTCNIALYLGPTVYERISAHLDFIQENTRDAIWCSP